MFQSGVHLSICTVLTLIRHAAHTQRDSPGSSTRRSQRTFPSQYKEDEHTCIQLFRYLRCQTEITPSPENRIISQFFGDDWSSLPRTNCSCCMSRVIVFHRVFLQLQSAYITVHLNHIARV